MTQYKPPRIDEEYGGITAYLDRTKIEHNGNGSVELKKLWNWGQKPHVSVLTLAGMYGVTWTTMDDWLNRLHKEEGIERLRPRREVK